jgi:hypothetical protein
MDAGDSDRIDDAKQQLRAAILFRNWRDARRALEALDEVGRASTGPTAFAAARGGYEFCPADGGGCCVCGGGRNSGGCEGAES